MPESAEAKGRAPIWPWIVLGICGASLAGGGRYISAHQVLAAWAFRVVIARPGSLLGKAAMVVSQLAGDYLMLLGCGIALTAAIGGWRRIGKSKATRS